MGRAYGYRQCYRQHIGFLVDCTGSTAGRRNLPPLCVAGNRAFGETDEGYMGRHPVQPTGNDTHQPYRGAIGGLHAAADCFSRTDCGRNGLVETYSADVRAIRLPVADRCVAACCIPSVQCSRSFARPPSERTVTDIACHLLVCRTGHCDRHPYQSVALGIAYGIGRWATG